MSRILDLGRQPGVPLEQWADQDAAERERVRKSFPQHPASEMEMEALREEAQALRLIRPADRTLYQKGRIDELETEYARRLRTNREKKMEKALRILTIGTCSCMVKSPELKYHNEGCVYRIAAEALLP